MPPKATKESKAAKLKAAREKAQKWADDQRNKRKRESLGSPVTKTGPTGTPIDKRRRRDENEPNGNRMKSERIQQNKNAVKAVSSHQMDVDVDTKHLAPAKSPNPVLSKQDKIQLAREKAAKWKNDKLKKKKNVQKEDVASLSSGEMEITYDTKPASARKNLNKNERIQVAREKAAKFRNENPTKTTVSTPEIGTKKPRKSIVACDVPEPNSRKSMDFANPEATVEVSPTFNFSRNFPNSVNPSDLTTKNKVDIPPKMATSPATATPSRVSFLVSKLHASLSPVSMSGPLRTSALPPVETNESNMNNMQNQLAIGHTNEVLNVQVEERPTSVSVTNKISLGPKEVIPLVPTEVTLSALQSDGNSNIDQESYHEPIRIEKVEDINVDPIARWRVNVEKRSTFSSSQAEEKVENSVKNETANVSFLKRSKQRLSLLTNNLLLLCTILCGVVFTYVLIDSTSFMWATVLDPIAPSVAVENLFRKRDKGEDGSLDKLTCFVDTVNAPDTESNVVPSSLLEMGLSCDKNESQAPCPTGGICYGGYLQSCYPPEFLEPSNRHTACEVSNHGEDLITQVKNRLVDMSVERICGCWFNAESVCLVDPSYNVFNDTSIDSDQSTSVMFRVEAISDVFGTSYYTLSSISASLSSHDIVLDKKSKVIGLSDLFLQNKLQIPTACYVRLLLVDLLTFFIGSFFSIVSTFLSTLTYCLANFPKTTVLVVLFTSVFCFVRRRRRRISALRDDTRRMRELAYVKLRARVGSKYSETHLRDDIMHQLCPDSLKMRKGLIANVWPRVVKEVRCDSRIQRGFSSGMEWWEWADKGTTNLS